MVIVAALPAAPPIIIKASLINMLHSSINKTGSWLMIEKNFALNNNYTHQDGISCCAL